MKTSKANRPLVDKRHRKKYPEASAAKSRLRNLVRKKIVIKTGYCVRCKKFHKRTHWHHINYCDRCNVIEVCKWCHDILHYVLKLHSVDIHSNKKRTNKVIVNGVDITPVKLFSNQHKYEREL